MILLHILDSTVTSSVFNALSSSSNLVIVVAIVIERGKDTLDSILESRNIGRNSEKSMVELI